jgi:hypothetical protein
MHYALPQRKSSSKVPAYAIRPNRSAFSIRRMRQQSVALTVVGFIAIIYLLCWIFGHSSSGLPSIVSTGYHTGADVVIVTAFRDDEDKSIQEHIIRNREQYAEKHGTSKRVSFYLFHMTKINRLRSVLPDGFKLLHKICSGFLG